MVKNTKENIYTGRERHEKKPLRMCFHLARLLSNKNVVGKIFWVRISFLAPSWLCLGSLLRTPGHFKPRAGCWLWLPAISLAASLGLACGLNSSHFPLAISSIFFDRWLGDPAFTQTRDSTWCLPQFPHHEMQLKWLAQQPSPKWRTCLHLGCGGHVGAL